jgi:hypothetical protein
MPEPAGDDLAIVLFCASLFVGFGLETMKAETASRKAIFGFLTAMCAANALFWLQIKKIWPPFTEVAASIATSPVAWFVVAMFILAVVAFHPAKSRNRAAAAAPPNRAAAAAPPINVKSANTDKPGENKPPEEKMVIDVTAEYLIGLYRGRTTIHADALADMYMGKWTTISGTVANVWKSTGGYRMIMCAAGNYDNLVTLDFGENAHVAYFTRESEITVHGKIESISGTGLNMTECSLVK